MNRHQVQLRSRDDTEPPDGRLRIKSIFSNGWLIGGVFLLVTAVGVYHALTVTPVYEASTVIQLKRNLSASGSTAAGALATTEIEILRSRSILSRVAARLHLDISVEPRHGSLIDRIRQRRTTGAAGGNAGLDAEQLAIAEFNVPKQLLKHPFLLTVETGNRFTLTDEETGTRIVGAPGNVASGTVRQGDIGILVTRMDAPAGAQFVVRRIPLLQATEQLQRSLTVTESGKQSNVVRATLQGTKPELISSILNEIGSQYMQQRHAEESGDAGKAAGQLDRQLAQSTQALQEADARYAQLLQRYGIADPAGDGKSVSDQSAALQAKLDEAVQRRIDLSSRFGDRHPSIEAVGGQIADLRRDLDRNEGKRKSMATAERQLASVSRDRQVLAEIHAGLLSQRSKFDTMLSSQATEVRLVDRSEPPSQPLTLGFPTMVALSCFAGLALGIVASIVKNAFAYRNRIRPMPQREARFRLISMARTQASQEN